MKIFLLALFSAILSVTTFAQQATKAKSDVILKVNGDELTGKVTEIGDSEIKFIYTGETLVYPIKKQDILKITYASGRIEFFNKPALPSDKKEETGNGTNAATSKSATDTEDHHNKVAILPFEYIKNSKGAGDEMGYKAQNDTYVYLNRHSAGLTILDPRTTNALLIKAGINRSNLMGYTMEEICNILGVEYLLDGSITQNFQSATTTSSGSSSSKTTKDDDKRKSSGYGYSSTTSSENYKTSVAINVYTDKNTSIYTETRSALLNQNEGVYDSPLEYLLKRCPLYRK